MHVPPKLPKSCLIIAFAPPANAYQPTKEGDVYKRTVTTQIYILLQGIRVGQNMTRYPYFLSLSLATYLLQLCVSFNIYRYVSLVNN